MAAYAALVSLMNTIDNIRNHSRLSTSLDNNLSESLGEKLDFFLHFVESHNSLGGISKDEVEDLERHIASTVHAAEDVTEAHIVDLIETHMVGSTFDHVKTSSSFLLDLLANILETIQNHPHHLTSDIDKKQIESMDKKIDFLLDFVGTTYNFDGGMSNEDAQDLESQIATENLAFLDKIGSLKDQLTFFKTLLDQLIIYMELILNHHRLLLTYFDKKAAKSLGQSIHFTIDFIQSNYNSAGGISKEEEDEEEEDQLESQIASSDLAAAEDVIESHEAGSTFEHGETSTGVMLDLQKEIKAMKKKVLKVLQKQRRKEANFGGSENSFLVDLQKILEEMDFIKKNVIQVTEKMGFKDERATNSTATSSSMPLTTRKTSAVGFDGYLVQLLDWLTGQQSHRQIIPITGMGGIGKTTLARKVYENSLIEQHFYLRAWVTVSQDYNVRDILFQILSCLVESTKELEKKTEGELGVELHKVLYGRRYLIILDDIWSIEAWNKTRIFLPENDNGSRIVVTTRQSDVANNFGSMGLALSFLEDDESWQLFCDKAFVERCCPRELEKTGRNIVQKCKGLPLSIVVIGGLLRKSSTTLEYWENVGKDLTTILNSAEDNQCLNILSLSYRYLPAHLKPCFLYLGIFPEDGEIHVSRLIQLWIAEGFLKPSKEKSLEEIGKGYIKDLADRNLVLVHRLSLNGKVRTCRIHDLLRDLCIKVGEKEKLFCMIRVRDARRQVESKCRIITLESIAKECDHLESTSLARSIIGDVPWKLSLKPRLLRVLFNANDDDSLVAAFGQVNLRFLKGRLSYQFFKRAHSYKLPSSLSLLWNLQTLIIEDSNSGVDAPIEIWEMQQLRHLEFYRLYLPKPPLSNEEDRVVLKNLHTLGVAWLFKFSKEVCLRMPNIKKLNIIISDNLRGRNTMSSNCFYNVGLLSKLESLKFDCFVVLPSRDDFLQNFKLPSSLKKLTLQNCSLYWDDLTLIGSLPHLEVLKLQFGSVRGSKWNPVEGDFLHLKYLQILNCGELVHWNADNCHFPILEKLELHGSRRLEEIPLGIGDIPTLAHISLTNCSTSAVISAMEIVEEQESMGNQNLRVRVKFWFEAEREIAKKKVELLGFSSPNFQLS